MNRFEIMWEWDGPEREMARKRRPGDSGEDDHTLQDVEDPLSRPPQLWRDHGKTAGGNGGIHVVVCCCNEDDEELKVMLGSFRHEGERPCRVQVSFILDRHDGGAFGEHHGETYQALRELLPVVPAGKAGKEGEEKLETANYDEFGCTSHPGVLSNASVPFELYVKGPGLPQGKRNSLVLFFDEILPTKIKRGEASEPDAVYVLDADTGHPNNGLSDIFRMWKLLMAEEETAAITCPVRPINLLESVLACSQGLEYAHVGDSLGESYYAAQTTCRSASCMFKYSCLIEDGRGALPPCGEGAQVPVLDALSYTAGSLSAMILLDTAPCEGLLVLLRQRGYDVRSCAIADAVTTVPNSLWEFYAQRRRWYAGSMTAVMSHLTGREDYFQNERWRSIMSTYVTIFNIYLYSNVLFLPVLLTKGISIMAACLNSSGEGDGYGHWTSYEELADSTLEWWVFGAIWLFLLMNVHSFRARSQKQLWMWINVSSVIWILFCAGVMAGVTIVMTPWIAVTILVAPLILGGLNAAGASPSYWAYMAMAAVPYALMTAVHSVLILLYAVATLDSSEWGTRDVASFDSGVTKFRANAMGRGTFKLLVYLVFFSLGLGAVMVHFSSYSVIPIVIGFAALVNILKFLVTVIPSKLERGRQRSIIGQTDLQRPLSFNSLRRGRADLASSQASVIDARPVRKHKHSASACLTEPGSFATMEDDTPSPDTAAALSLVLPRAAPSAKKSGSIDDCTVAMTPPRRGGQPGTSASHSRNHSQTSRPSTRSPSSGCVGLSGSFDGVVVGDDPDYSIHGDEGQSDETAPGSKSRERGGTGGSGEGAHGGKSSAGGNASEATSGHTSEPDSVPCPSLGAGGVGFKGLFSRSSTASSMGEYDEDGPVDTPKNQLVEIELSPPRPEKVTSNANSSLKPPAGDTKSETTGSTSHASQATDGDESLHGPEARQNSMSSSTASSVSQNSSFRGRSPLGLPPSGAGAGAGARTGGIARKRSMDSDEERTPRSRTQSVNSEYNRSSSMGSVGGGGGGQGIAFNGDGEVKRKSGGSWANLLRSDSFTGTTSDSAVGRPPNVPRRGSRTLANAPGGGNSMPSTPVHASSPGSSSTNAQGGGSDAVSGDPAAANTTAGNKTTTIVVAGSATPVNGKPGNSTAGGAGSGTGEVASTSGKTPATSSGGNTPGKNSVSLVTACSTPTANTTGKKRHWGQRPSSVDSQESISPGRLASINAKRNSRTTFAGRLGWGFGVDSPDGYGSPLSRMLGGSKRDQHSELTGVRRSWGRGASSDDYEDPNPYAIHHVHSPDDISDAVLMRRNWIQAQGSMDSQDEAPSPRQVALMQKKNTSRGSLVGSRRSWGFASSMESDDAMDIPGASEHRLGRGIDPRRRGSSGGHHPLMGGRSSGRTPKEPEDHKSMFRGLFAQYIVGPQDDAPEPDNDYPRAYQGATADPQGNWGRMVEYSEDDYEIGSNQGGAAKRRSPSGHRYPVRTSSAPNLSTRIGASPRMRVSKGNGRRGSRSRRSARTRRAALPTVAEPWGNTHPGTAGWSVGQNSVFDTSGSSSGEERSPPQGLDGVLVLDPKASSEKRMRHGNAGAAPPSVQMGGMTGSMALRGEGTLRDGASCAEAQPPMGNADVMERNQHRDPRL